MVRVFGFGPASCRSTQKEGFLGGGCDFHPNRQRRMTHGEMQHCNTGHKSDADVHTQEDTYKKGEQFNLKHNHFQGFDTFNWRVKTSALLYLCTF